MTQAFVTRDVIGHYRDMDWREKVAAHLRRQGLTQIDLAQGAGIPHATVSNWFRMSRPADPSITNARKLAAFLGVSLDELFGDGPPLGGTPLSVSDPEFQALIRRLALEALRDSSAAALAAAAHPAPDSRDSKPHPPSK